MPTLRSFKLSYEVKWHGCGYEIDCGAIMVVIEELSFYMMDNYSPLLSYIESMKKFKRLKDVELDLRLFIGPQDPDHQDSKEGIIAKLRLADLLPPTVERICLLVEDMDMRDQNSLLNNFFSGVAADLPGKFPNLKEIKIRTKPDRTGIRLDDFIHLEPGSEEPESSPAQEFKDINAAKNRAWTIDLKAMDPSIQITIIKVGSIVNQTRSGNQTVLAHFMTGFCDRYGVTCR
jgi:hypothetical protein